MSQISDSLGRMLREARKAHGFTQAQLAEQLHTTQQTISNWEANSYQPDYDSLVALSKLLHLDIPLVPAAVEAPTEEAEPLTTIKPRGLGRRARITLICVACALVVSLCAWLASSHFHTQTLIREGAEKKAWFQSSREEMPPEQADIHFWSDPNPARLAQTFSGTLPKWNIRMKMDETNGVGFTIQSIESVLFYRNGTYATMPVVLKDYFDKPVSQFRIEAFKSGTNSVSIEQDAELLAVGYILYGVDDKGHELQFKNYVNLLQ